MIKNLDATFKLLLTSEAEDGSLLKSANISFVVPDETWRNTGNNLELNIYLYDIRENRTLRTNEFTREYQGDGISTPRTVIKRKVDPRLDCSYVITAWDKSTTPDKEEKIENEHALLSEVLQVLLINPIIPETYLQGPLIGQKPDLRLSTSQVEGVPNPVEFWNGLGTPYRPSINCALTITLDLIKPEITSKEVKEFVNNINLK